VQAGLRALAIAEPVLGPAVPDRRAPGLARPARVQADAHYPSPDRTRCRFAKDQFRIDLQAQTVTCPARVTVAIIPARRGGGRARFGPACTVCPLRSACTSSVRGRVVAIHPYEAELTAARARQRDPSWRADYRATRPKVERKLAHLLRRRHGGRRARVRGLVRVGQDFKLLAAAVNLARFATLGLCSTADGWQVQPA
jgi:Transposase DDE domain